MGGAMARLGNFGRGDRIAGFEDAETIQGTIGDDRSGEAADRGEIVLANPKRSPDAPDSKFCKRQAKLLVKRVDADRYRAEGVAVIEPARREAGKRRRVFDHGVSVSGGQSREDIGRHGALSGGLREDTRVTAAGGSRGRVATDDHERSGSASGPLIGEPGAARDGGGGALVRPAQDRVGEIYRGGERSHVDPAGSGERERAAGGRDRAGGELGFVAAGELRDALQRHRAAGGSGHGDGAGVEAGAGRSGAAGGYALAQRTGAERNGGDVLDR